jgi:hypothetical protein
MTAVRIARADDPQSLDFAKSPFDNGQYAEAHVRLSALLDPQAPPCESAPIGTRCHLTSVELVERARALDAASLLALKREAEADRLIGAILRANPNYVPSPASFPQEVIDRFNTVRVSLDAELRTIAEQRAKEAEAKRLAAQKAHDDEEAWLAELQKLAGKERWVETNSRWIALVPFGIGQFQNGDVRLGVTFAVGEAALGGTSLIALAIINSLARTNVNLPTASGAYPSISGLNANLNTATVVNQVSFTAWAALTLAGVVQAQVAFVPEKVTFHDRSVPPRPRAVPIAVPVSHGAVLGLAGTF